MTLGKQICKELKTLRRDIAAQNEISLHIPECTYEGECSGTCPRCEAELHTLEQALEQRMRMGKVAMVAGVALTMGLSHTAQAQQLVQPDPIPTGHMLQAVSTCCLYGVVTDQQTDRPVTSALVRALRDNVIVDSSRTDMDGHYELHLAYGRYEVQVIAAGYDTFRTTLDLDTERKMVAFTLQQPSIIEIRPGQLAGHIANEPPQTHAGLEIVSSRVEPTATDTLVIRKQKNDRRRHKADNGYCELEGTIIDERNDEPLPFVNLLLTKEEERVTGATTDLDGHYKIQVPYGQFMLRISAVGYGTTYIAVRAESGSYMQKDFVITNRPIQTLGMPIIEVKQPLIDIGNTTSGGHISSEQLERSPSTK